jgi:CheY-like chemotaxis protein
MNQDPRTEPTGAAHGVSVVIFKQVAGTSMPVKTVVREPASQDWSTFTTTEHANRAVLAVEDSPVHLKIVTRYVEQALGCRVVPADGVEAAILALLREPPDLIISDLMMPNLDGLDLVQILGVREAWRDIPVVIHSAANHLSGVRALSEFGVKDYILKPFDPAIALPRLRRVLGAHPGPAQRAPCLPPVPRARVPILLVTRRVELVSVLARALDPLYEVVAVESGAAAVVATLEMTPWLVFVCSDAAGWGAAKTRRSLLSLHTVPRVRVTPLACAGDEAGLVAAVQREIAEGPFTVEGEATLVVRLRETFTTGCLDALGALLTARVAEGTAKIVFEIPSESIEPHALAGVTGLARKFRR